MELPIRCNSLYRVIGTKAPLGVLLYGASGTGKTRLAKAACVSAGATLVEVSATEVSEGKAGEAEALLREKFSLAKENAPAVLLLDELDTLVPKSSGEGGGGEVGGGAGQGGTRLVSQLVTLLDDVSRWRENVVVVATTSRPAGIDPSVRRAGRFDNEVIVPIPDQKVSHTAYSCSPYGESQLQL